MEKKHSNPLMIIAKTILLILTAIYPFFMVIMSGAGLVYNSDSYGGKLTRAGIILIVSGIIMTTGAILCMFRKNIPNIVALICSVGGFALCIMMLRLICFHADAAGWTDKYAMTPISDMYKARIVPSVAPAIIATAVSLIQIFSYDASEERRRRRKLREERENAPAPKIIDD